MTEQTHRQLQALSEYLATRRDAILEASRIAENRDPEQTTVHSLTRAQFNDHIPEVLTAFEARLWNQSRGTAALEAKSERQADEAKHGLHRWQQGYRLRELMHEWGHLHRCIFDEIESFAQSHPGTDRECMVEAQRQLLALISEAISESTGEYARLQQDEAAGVLSDLQRILTEFKEMDRRRAELIHQAVHDLRGNVQSVSSAAEVLVDPSVPELERKLFATLLQQGADAVGSTLVDLMDLARLEAGQETREIENFDVSALLNDFCAVTQPLARDRQLFLRADGPPSLKVDGDPAKIRRIVQNLVLNSLKYTHAGGVTVSWGDDERASWWVKIQDSGPGLMSGPGAPIVQDMVEATDSARESEKKSTVKTADGSSVLPAAVTGGSTPRLPARQQRGEGIGLSIVKRLCELLDASIELTSSKESGTTFRVVFPRVYALPARTTPATHTT
jgi:signal transduction histidine kinase